MSDLQSQLKEMAQLTVLSGRISEVQVKNLRMYPLIFFNGVVQAKVQYDLSSKKTTEDERPINPSIVSYYLEIDEKENNDSLDKRFEALENSVRTLFWNDITVEVYFNNKIVYKSKTNV